jgi:hypothetical protein
MTALPADTDDEPGILTAETGTAVSDAGRVVAYL